jgi:hypothetical protein
MHPRFVSAALACSVALGPARAEDLERRSAK